MNKLRLQWDDLGLEFLHEDVPGSENLKPVFRASSDVGSDVVEMLALFSPENKMFYWVTGRGCSCCTNITDPVEAVEDLKQGDERALKHAIREMLKEAPHILNEEDKKRVFSKIKKCK